MPPSDRAILLVVHTDTVIGEPYTWLANRLAAQTQADVRCYAISTFRTTLSEIAAQGLKEILIVPLVIGAAHPVVGEIAAVQAWAQAQWPSTSFRNTAPYADAPLLASLLVRQLTVALARAPDVDRNEVTAIVLAPYGSESDLNAELASVVRRFWERSGVGWAELAFLQAGTPDLPTALRRSQMSGSSATIIVPITLFADATYQRIASKVAELDVLLAAPLVSIEGATATVAVRVAQGEALAHHAHDHSLLPTRYQNGAPVRAAPMAAAALKYDAEGRVAWDEIWGDFCDLGLAGGPAHRGTLLEPASPEAVCADPASYNQVVAELERGLRMVTELEVLTNTPPGWIGLRCRDEAMSIWLLRAILVENVAARREGSIIFLPAGPHFRLEHEIKNVVTVVAKTHHYWTEHAGR